jgi:hypothetical protein
MIQKLETSKATNYQVLVKEFFLLFYFKCFTSLGTALCGVTKRERTPQGGIKLAIFGL